MQAAPIHRDKDKLEGCVYALLTVWQGWAQQRFQGRAGGGSEAAAPRDGTTHPRVGLQPPPRSQGREKRCLSSQLQLQRLVGC